MPHPRLALLTKETVIRVAKKTSPQSVRKWGVVINGTEYPVNQIFMAAANAIDSSAPRLTPADFTAHSAAKKLQKLGLEVKYHE